MNNITKNIHYRIFHIPVPLCSPRTKVRSKMDQMKISEPRINLILQYQNMETPQVQHRAAVMFASEKGQL